MLTSRIPTAIAVLVGTSLACNVLAGSGSPAAPTNTPSAPGPLADYGDAPDPAFPSLFASNGAHTLDITQFWLGNFADPSATTERDAKIVNRDELDDGLERIKFQGATPTLAFRAVKGKAASDGVAYFNLLVDLNGDGHWQGQPEWVVENREVSLAPGASELIEAPLPPQSLSDVWIRAALTDERVDPAAFPDGWDGTGEFARGEVEDYLLSVPAFPPPTEPPFTPTPTPTPTRYITSVPPKTQTPTVTPKPPFVYTGDFVPVCDPDGATILHGESIFVRLKLVSGAETPPERFIVGLEYVVAPDLNNPEIGRAGQGTLQPVPLEGLDGWSAWGDEVGFVFKSLAVDGPERVEDVGISIVLQSRSTTRFLFCRLHVKHAAALPALTPTPTATATPQKTVLTLDVFPRRVSLGGTVSITGDGFAPNGQVTKTFVRPDGFTFRFQTTADAYGVVIGSLALTQDQPLGEWRVIATDEATGRQAQATFTVVP
jgi:hypothetical protein